MQKKLLLLLGLFIIPFSIADMEINQSFYSDGNINIYSYLNGQELYINGDPYYTSMNYISKNENQWSNNGISQNKVSYMIDKSIKLLLGMESSNDRNIIKIADSFSLFGLDILNKIYSELQELNLRLEYLEQAQEYYDPEIYCQSKMIIAERHNYDQVTCQNTTWIKMGDMWITIS